MNSQKPLFINKSFSLLLIIKKILDIKEKNMINEFSFFFFCYHREEGAADFLMGSRV